MGEDDGGEVDSWRDGGRKRRLFGERPVRERRGFSFLLSGRRGGGVLGGE